MALPDAVSAGGRFQPGQTGSTKGAVVVANTDLKTAASDVYAPLSETARVVPVKISDGATRVLLRARITKSTSSITTNPRVVLYAVYLNGASDIADGVVWRVDNTDADANGLDITLPADPSSDDAVTVSVGGTDYVYSDTVSLDGTDLKGADYLLAVVSRAASFTGSADLEVLVIS